MIKKLWSYLLCLIGFFLLFVGIPIGGPMLSRAYGKYCKEKIDRNGVAIKAVVRSKSYNKGRYIRYSYWFDGTKYTDHEQSDSLYELYNAGDTIDIMIDGTNPENSYVIDKHSQNQSKN